MATGALSPTCKRRRSSKPMPRSSCATSQRLPTVRYTILPASVAPAATCGGSCRTRSAATHRFWVVRTAPASSSLWRLAMRRSTLAICALLTVATLGCEQVDTAKAKLKLAWDKLRGRSTTQAPAPPPVRPAPDTAAARIAAQQQDQGQRPRPPAAPQGQALTRDVPYVSDDTGTVNPGMAEREVSELWAAPAAARRRAVAAAARGGAAGCRAGGAEIALHEVPQVRVRPDHGRVGRDSDRAVHALSWSVARCR